MNAQNSESKMNPESGDSSRFSHSSNNPTIQPLASHPSIPAVSQSFSDPDEINLLEYIYVLVKNKWWIIGAMVLGLVGGYVAAIVKGPTWVAEAVIASKETDKATPQIAGFGALGGMVANQLNLGGNASLEKIDVIINTKTFNEEMIKKYDLLPQIYRISWPEKYNQFYDTTQKTWKNDFNQPNLRGIGSSVRGDYLTIEIKKDNTMQIDVNSPDSLFSLTLMQCYLSFLNEYIQSDVKNESRQKILYLEKQLSAVSNPLLAERIQGLIANEIEKIMTISHEAFKVLDPPYLMKRFREKKIYPLFFGFLLFSISTGLICVIYAFNSVPKSKNDKDLLAKIKGTIVKL